MNRFIDNELRIWKEAENRKPLIVRGARQVGKTYSIQKFGRECFENLVHLDLEKQPRLHSVFSGDLSAQHVTADLEILTGQPLRPGKTLLFLDEVQACPRAVTALRYFYEEMPDLHVIAAGSLLEFALGDLSFPVGRVQMTWMRPLCFAEYLAAHGKDNVAELVLQPPHAVSEAVHAMLLDELRRYLFVGGMPEAVAAHVKTDSFKRSFEVHDEICSSYRQDFAKYRPRCDNACLDEVLLSAARHVGSEVTFAHLAEGYAHATIKKAFHLLSQALVLTKVQATSPSGLPLGACVHSSALKALLVDIGLMNHLSGLRMDLEYGESDLLDIHRGALAEQFVGQEMLLSQRGDLYYWSRRAKSSGAEVDYLAVMDGVIHPVEVKSGSAGRLRSLHLCLKEYPACGDGIVLSMRPYQVLKEQRLTFVPLYFALSATSPHIAKANRV